MTTAISDKLLTERQHAIWEWMLRYQHTNGRPAAFRDIGYAFDINSPNGVATNLQALEQKGFARKLPGMPARGVLAIIPGQAADKASATSEGDQVRLRLGCVSGCLSRDEALTLAAQLTDAATSTGEAV